MIPKISVGQDTSHTMFKSPARGLQLAVLQSSVPCNPSHKLFMQQQHTTCASLKEYPHKDT